jgi:demethylmenaquinone methyltransferase/2-methoxy-6-polyprenyl-1,4-benzoquinol methylase
MPDMDDYARKLFESFPLIESVTRSAIQALRLPAGSRGLDAGCGVGHQALLLAEAVGPAGHVTGLDLSPAFLVHAGRLAEERGLSDRVSFREGDANNLPFEDDTFDWTWSKDAVGYYPGDPRPPLNEFSRVVRPGGTVAILAWSSQQLLPGYPRLEARLNATSAGIAPFRNGAKPERHFFHALGWFRDLGLRETGAQTFAGEVYAPLSDEIRTALISLFEMRWGGAQSELSRDDWELYRRLTRPGSSDFILDHPDYYAFFNYSLFHGKVAK